MKREFSFLLSAAFLMTACKSSGGGGTPVSTASEFSELFSDVDSAFGSLGDVGFGGELTRFLSKAEGSNFSEAQSELDDKCSDKGSPWDGLTAMSMSNSLYSSRLFYCLATLGEGGPDTVRGSYSTPKAVLCSVDKALGEVDYTVQGNEFTDVSIAINSGCFTPSMLEDMGEVSSLSLDSITFTELDPEVTGWQKKVSLSSSQVGIDYTLYYFKTENAYGFRSVEGGNAPGTGGVVSLMVNTSTGDLVYSNLDDRGGPVEALRGPDSLYKRITRVYVNGDVASDGTFTTLNEASGVYAQSGSASSYGELDTEFTVATIKGDSTVGYKSYVYSVTDGDGASSSSAASVGEVSSNCFDGNEACTEEMPVTSQDATDLYQKTSTNSSAWSEYRDNGQPLCAGHVEFSAVPLTGPLGDCSR